jgi:hypothetical protein
MKNKIVKKWCKGKGRKSLDKRKHQRKKGGGSYPTYLPDTNFVNKRTKKHTREATRLQTLAVSVYLPSINLSIHSQSAKRKEAQKVVSQSQ